MSVCVVCLDVASKHTRLYERYRERLKEVREGTPAVGVRSGRRIRMRRLFLGWAGLFAVAAILFLSWAVWGVCNGPRAKTLPRLAMVVGFPCSTGCIFSSLLAFQAVTEWRASRFHGALCFACAVLIVTVPAGIICSLLLIRE